MEENEQETGSPNQASKLLGRIQENRKSLHIARVPDKTKEAFMKLAEEEFCGDYGMVLKWLMDDILSHDTRIILAQLENHETRMQELENSHIEEPEETEAKGKTMLDGSKKDVRGTKKK